MTAGLSSYREEHINSLESTLVPIGGRTMITQTISGWLLQVVEMLTEMEFPMSQLGLTGTPPWGQFLIRWDMAESISSQGLMETPFTSSMVSGTALNLAPAWLSLATSMATEMMIC
jgi:hypothetical protein